nr:hypothetical protein CFP56_78749 [Quercus suber]
MLQRWDEHTLPAEHNIRRYISPMAVLNMIFFLLICSELNMASCRASILYVGAGALQEALAALREAQQPDTAAMFILACREIYAEIIADLGDLDDESSYLVKDKLRNLPVLDPGNEDVIAVGECYGQCPMTTLGIFL